MASREFALTAREIVTCCVVGGALSGQLALTIACLVALAGGSGVLGCDTMMLLLFGPIIGGAVAMPFGGLVGLLGARFLVRPLRHKPRDRLVARVLWPTTIAVAGLSVLLLNPWMLAWGSGYAFAGAVLGSAVVFVWIVRRAARELPEIQSGHACQDCGYDLRGSHGSACCPECGRAFAWTDELEQAARDVRGQGWATDAGRGHEGHR